MLLGEDPVWDRVEEITSFPASLADEVGAPRRSGIEDGTP